MTARVCKKCRFYIMSTSKCSLRNLPTAAWDDACKSYELKGSTEARQ